MIVIFHTYIKYKDKSCKIIINNKNYINAITSIIVAHQGLKYVPHP